MINFTGHLRGVRLIMVFFTFVVFATFVGFAIFGASNGVALVGGVALLDARVSAAERIDRDIGQAADRVATSDDWNISINWNIWGDVDAREGTLAIARTLRIGSIALDGSRSSLDKGDSGKSKSGDEETHFLSLYCSVF